MSDDYGDPWDRYPADDNENASLRSFLKGFLGFGIPMALSGLLSTAVDVNSSPLVLVWFVGPLVAIVALIVMLYFYATDRPWTGTGTLAAMAVGALVLTVTCFANLAELGF